MAITTITLNDEAYSLLRTLKSKGESFSDVVIRNVRVPADTCGELLERIEAAQAPEIEPARLQRGRRSKRRS